MATATDPRIIRVMSAAEADTVPDPGRAIIEAIEAAVESAIDRASDKLMSRLADRPRHE